MINRIVTVTIDRPMGSYHPEYKDMYYPINYGYIEGVMADDGEEQDAYVIGVDKPLETFTGKVIAVIKRHDDVEDKWAVCPEGCNYTKEEIQRLTEFQEKFFDSEIFLG
ncbi:MAG: inorganic diphosphatase [Ruminococcus sp.]|nr:inorganic diphosphatase [Ruminococcus sp.]